LGELKSSAPRAIISGAFSSGTVGSNQIKAIPTCLGCPRLCACSRGATYNSTRRTLEGPSVWDLGARNHRHPGFLVLFFFLSFPSTTPYLAPRPPTFLNGKGLSLFTRPLSSFLFRPSKPSSSTYTASHTTYWDHRHPDATYNRLPSVKKLWAPTVRLEKKDLRLATFARRTRTDISVVH
ncbi:hypothetical protein F5X68DRAFT_258259, partial [Plectosphaerella plurivora]